MTLEDFRNDQGMIREQRQMIEQCETDKSFMRMLAEVLEVGRDYLDWISNYKHPKKCILLNELIKEACQQPVAVLFYCMLARQKFEVLDKLSAHHNCPCCDLIYEEVNKLRR